MNSLEKEFIPYELALEMKQLGFDEPCFGFYRIYTSEEIKLIISYEKLRHVEAPTFSQCFRWFRENCMLNSDVVIGKTNFGFKIQYLSTYVNNWYAGYKTYEEAEIECLKQLIKIVKDGKQ